MPVTRYRQQVVELTKACWILVVLCRRPPRPLPGRRPPSFEGAGQLTESWGVATEATCLIRRSDPFSSLDMNPRRPYRQMTALAVPACILGQRLPVHY